MLLHRQILVPKLLHFLKKEFKSNYIFQNRAPADVGAPTSLGTPAL